MNNQNNTPINPQDNPLALPWAAMLNTESPQYRTKRELDRVYDNPNEKLDMGFFGKLGSAFAYETVTGEAIRDYTGSDFPADPNFKVTDDLIEEYASDFLPEVQERIRESATSFPGFLHEVDDVRIANRRREAMFSGGAWDLFTGLTATIIGSGSEAVLATLGAGAAGTFVGGPVGTVGAATTTAVGKYKRIANIINSTRKGLQAGSRARAIAQAGAITAGVDVPLELLRYQLDKSLTKTDLLVAVGASAVLGGGLAAWKPGLYSKPIREMIDDSVKEEAAVAARKIGQDDIAEELKLTPKKVTVVSDETILDDVLKMSTTDLRAEAARRGIDTRIKGRFRKGDDIRQDIVDARRADSPNEEIAVRQMERNLEGLQTPALRKKARDMGLTVKKAAKAQTIKKMIMEATRQAVRTGRLQTIKKVRLGSKLIGRQARTAAGGVSRKIEFDTSVEKGLYRLGGSKKDFEGKKELVAALKELGIDNPEALGKELRNAVKAKVKEMGAVEGNVRVKSEELLGKSIIPREADRLRMEVDEDLFQPPASKVKKTKKEETGEEPHPISDEPEVIMVQDGKEVSRGPIPAVDGEVINVAAKDLGSDVLTEGAGTALAKQVSRTTIPGLRWVSDLLASSSQILKGMNSPLIRDFASVFAEDPLAGGKNLETIVMTNRTRVMTKLMRPVSAARKKAIAAGMNKDEWDQTVTRRLTATDMIDKSGGSLDELSSIELSRLGFKGNAEIDEAVGEAVKALQSFNKSLAKYASINGLLPDIKVLDPSTYFKRIYRHTKFAEFEEEEIIDFFTEAILKKTPAMSKGKAGLLAERITSFGKDPTAHRSLRDTQKFIEGIREDLITSKTGKSKKEQLGLSDDDVEDVIDMITQEVAGEPHVQGFRKKRIDFDENYVGKIAGNEVHIDEFLNRNILKTTSQYSHNVLGAVEMKKGMERVFGKTIGGDAAKQRLAKAAEESGDDKQFVEDAFDLFYKRILGQRLYDISPRQTKFILGVQSFAAGTMGQLLGIAQLPEIASVMMRAGITNALEAFPGLKTLSDTILMGVRGEARGADGQLMDKVMSQLETFVGCGSDRLIDDHLLRRLDDMGIDDDVMGGVLGKFLEIGRNVSLLNPLGIMPMDTFLRRWATKSHFQNFVNEAYKLKNGSPALVDNWWRKGRTRFKQIGLSDSNIDRVMKALADPDVIKVKQGVFGKYKVMDIDFTKVKDQGAYDLLALAMRRAVDSTVQRQSVGELPLWMSKHPLAKLFTQYRVFMIASRGKQLAAGIARGDVSEAVNLVGSMGLGYLGYLALTYGRSLNVSDEERENYLAEKLSAENSWKSAIMRSAYSSILPMIIDSVGHKLTGETVFSSSGRTTGQDVGILGGTVPFTVLKNLSNTLGETIRLGDPYSKRDARDTMRLIWATQMPGVNQLGNYLINKSNLPETDRRR